MRPSHDTTHIILLAQESPEEKRGLFDNCNVKSCHVSVMMPHQLHRRLGVMFASWLAPLQQVTIYGRCISLAAGK